MIFAYAKINMSGSHYATTARSITLLKDTAVCAIFLLLSFHLVGRGEKIGQIFFGKVKFLSQFGPLILNMADEY